VIGSIELEAGMRGHLELTRVAGQGALDIDRIMLDLDIDPAEAQAALSALFGERMYALPDDSRASYQGGLIDGLLIGVRAARREAAGA
jgi:hypothetical protein